MVKMQIRISKDFCEEVMDALGNVENGLEFIDLNKDNLEAKKGYAGLLKRCEEIEKKIRKFDSLCNQYDTKLFNYQKYEKFRNDLIEDQIQKQTRKTDYFDILESEVINEDKELDIILENKFNNLENLNNLIEKREILKKLRELTQINNYRYNCQINRNNFTDKISINNNTRDNLISEDIDFNNNINMGNINNKDIQIKSNRQSIIKDGNEGLQFISGVILSENEQKLRKTVFRVTFGIGLVSLWDLNKDSLKTIIDNSYKDSKIYNQVAPKKIFTIFIKKSYDETNYLYSKLTKICDTLGVTRYNIPSSHLIPNLLEEIERDILKLEKVMIEQNNLIKSSIINKIGNLNKPGKYALYSLFFKKQKEIYLNLTKCISSNNFYNGEVWILDSKLNEINDQINQLGKQSTNHHGTKLTNINKIEDLSNIDFNSIDKKNIPPTFIESNSFLWPFQEIVNTYGIPRYQEINPTVFNIVTFPFLFGVMFGDIGHGFILLLLGLYLCIFQKEIKNNKMNILRSILNAKYLILFMGFFACYCGLIYNEFFSIAIPIFGGTCYSKEISLKNNVKEFQKKDKNCVYILGLDPKWQIAQNELSFHNSAKMKLSVILGVFHMIFGIILKGINCIHFRNTLGFIFEFIPQIVFMVMLFGYMDIMIFIKWMRNWENNESNAPSLISNIMNIFLSLGNVNNKPLWEQINTQKKYFQETWHLIVLITCLICIPLMLIPKPIIEYFKSDSKRNNKEKPYIQMSSFSDERPLKEEDIEGENLEELEESNHLDHHSFGDLFVHQTIETIEFVLGSISNTASYLRLWALSLAHGQLSKVFFQKALSGAFRTENIFYGVLMLLIGFFLFANITFGVLMCMDLLECFLHTLRLHWVEFQNKFYKADGYKFRPFSFKQLLSSQLDK